MCWAFFQRKCEFFSNVCDSEGCRCTVVCGSGEVPVPGSCHSRLVGTTEEGPSGPGSCGSVWGMVAAVGSCTRQKKVPESPRARGMPCCRPLVSPVCVGAFVWDRAWDMGALLC